MKNINIQLFAGSGDNGTITIYSNDGLSQLYSGQHTANNTFTITQTGFIWNETTYSVAYGGEILGWSTTQGATTADYLVGVEYPTTDIISSFTKNAVLYVVGSTTIKFLNYTALTALVNNIKNLVNTKQNALSTAQLNAVNSGVTSTTVSQVATNTSNISSLQTNKQNKLTAGTNITISNNVISASGGGTTTTVKVDDVSITSNNEANIVTKSGDYNSTSNRFLTENDIKEYTAAEIEAMFN